MYSIKRISYHKLGYPGKLLILADSKEDLEKAKQEILNQYPRNPYSTYFEDEHKDQDGQYSLLAGHFGAD